MVRVSFRGHPVPWVEWALGVTGAREAGVGVGGGGGGATPPTSAGMMSAGDDGTASSPPHRPLTPPPPPKKKRRRFKQTDNRAQELCGSRGGSPGFPVPSSPTLSMAGRLQSVF